MPGYVPFFKTVGAHPGYPDLMGFGRRKMVLSHDEVKNYVKYQIGALAAFTKSYGISFSMWLLTGQWEIPVSMTKTFPRQSVNMIKT